jgi:hypothetical protein
MIYIGAMRSAMPGIWANDQAERTKANMIFATPLDNRTTFTEPHGFWWGLLDVIWPSANILHVWVEQ